jgi:hypothetical protein
MKSRPDLSVAGCRQIYLPIGPSLIGIESKPNSLEQVDEDVKLDEINNTAGEAIKTPDELKKHFKVQELRNKQTQPDKPAKFQLAGEMLSAAVRNYQNQPRKTSHTIFGL